jgi:hypothetical protein
MNASLGSSAVAAGLGLGAGWGGTIAPAFDAPM